MAWINDLRIPVRRFDTLLPEIKLPKIPASRALAELHQMSDDEIQNFLDSDLKDAGPLAIIAVQLALHELAMRRLDRATRPNWSQIWMFWLVVGSFIAAVITVLLMLR
jgi:hypothetical protein